MYWLYEVSVEKKFYLVHKLSRYHGLSCHVLSRYIGLRSQVLSRNVELNYDLVQSCYHVLSCYLLLSVYHVLILSGT